VTKGVFDWVAQRAHGRLLVFLTVLLVGCSAWLFWMGQPLATAEAPDGIVSFELAGTAERSEAILRSWSGPAGSDDARSAALLIQGFDFLYLFVYTAWFSLAVYLASTRFDGRWGRIGAAISWAVLLAAPLDAVENHALNQQLLHGASEGYAQLALWCALPKFALVAVAALFLVLSGLARLTQVFAR
jgi:hypothetical protein